MSDPNPTMPPGDPLSRAVATLSAKGDLRGVVRLVERWAASGEPPREALLHQCRALVELRLMDRAWVRLNELIGEDPEDAEALSLAAEMFIERGWPNRARKLLDRVPAAAREGDAWADLARRADAPPLQPAPNAREIEERGSPAEQLQLAERFQAAGSFLRARSILERLRRVEGPWSRRVDDLLWALSGEFAKEDLDPVALARTLLPSLDEERPDLTESSPERTATGLDEDTHDEEAEDGASFPALFRRLDEPTETDGGEVTSISVMADKDALRRRLLTEEDAEAEDELVEDGYEDGRSGDTQIMLIMRRGGGDAEPAAEAPTHRRRSDEPEAGARLHETLNLRAYQESMGMAPVSGREFSEEVALEEEDDDLIVVTRREKDPAHAPTDPPPEPEGPVQVIEKPIAPASTAAPPAAAASLRPARRTPPRLVARPQAPAVDRAPPPVRRPAISAPDADERPGPSGAPLALRLGLMAFVMVLVGLGLVLLLSVVLGS